MQKIVETPRLKRRDGVAVDQCHATVLLTVMNILNKLRLWSRRLGAVVVQDTRGRRSCHAGYRAQILVNGAQFVVGHALEKPPRHDL
jgi:hypothetical protein